MGPKEQKNSKSIKGTLSDVILLFISLFKILSALNFHLTDDFNCQIVSLTRNLILEILLL